MALPGIPTGLFTMAISSFTAFRYASLYLRWASHSFVVTILSPLVHHPYQVQVPDLHHCDSQFHLPKQRNLLSIALFVFSDNILDFFDFPGISFYIIICNLFLCKSEMPSGRRSFDHKHICRSLIFLIPIFQNDFR